MGDGGCRWREGKLVAMLDGQEDACRCGLLLSELGRRRGPWESSDLSVGTWGTFVVMEKGIETVQIVPTKVSFQLRW